MICYLDRTFCVTKNCKNACGRKLTDEIRQGAIQAGLPVMVSLLCETREVPINGLLTEVIGSPDLSGGNA